MLLTTALLIPILASLALAVLNAPLYESLQRLGGPFWDFAWRMFSFNPDFLGNLDRFKNLPRSFWALVGWAKVGPPLFVHLALSALAALGILHAALYLLPERLRPFGNLRRTANLQIDRTALAFNFLGILLIALAIIKNFTTSTNVQGRLLFPSFAPIAFLVVAGWRAALKPSRGKWLLGALTAGLVVFNLYIWVALVIPIFFQPFLDS